MTVSAAATLDSTNNLSGDGSTELEPIVVNGGSGGVIQADGYVGTSSATGAERTRPSSKHPSPSLPSPKSSCRTAIRKISSTPTPPTPGARQRLRHRSALRFLFVRGFNVTNTGVFRDNLRQPASGYGIFITEPYGLEGVSILRSPSSALYGATGAGGLYNVITKRPTEEAQREVQFQLGTDQRYRDSSTSPARSTTKIRSITASPVSVASAIRNSMPFPTTGPTSPGLHWKPDEDTKHTRSRRIFPLEER